MPIRVIDPNAHKTIDVNGTKVVIRPLRPNIQRQAFNLWREAAGDINVDSESDDEAGQKIFMASVNNVDRDELAEAVVSGLVSIEGHEDTDPLELLQLLDHGDFWAIALQIMQHTGLDEEEVKNSPSSSEVNTPGSTGSAETAAGSESAPASTAQNPEQS